MYSLIWILIHIHKVERNNIYEPRNSRHSQQTHQMLRERHSTDSPSGPQREPTRPTSSLQNCETVDFCCLFKKKFFLNVYLFLRRRETQHERGRGRERGRHRIWNRLQALSCQQTARRGARTHGPRDHDLSWSQPLNRLSHPGAPIFFLLFWLFHFN